MTLDPRIGMYLSIICAVLSFVIGATATLTDLFGPDTTKLIVGVSVLVNGVINSINAVLHAIPSKAGAANEFPLGPSVPKP